MSQGEKKNEGIQNYLTFQEIHDQVTMDILHHVSAVKQGLTPEDDMFPILTPLVVGNKGIGKSRLARMIACETLSDIFEGRYQILRVSSMPEGEIGGIPDINQNEANMVYKLPSWWNVDYENKPVLIFFDEINRGQEGDPSVQMIHGIVSERQIHGRKMPLLWPIIAAMNPPDGKYQVMDILADESMETRFKVYHMVSQVTEFLQWGKQLNKQGKPNIHPVVSKYIDLNKEEFDTVRNCSRTWHEVSKDLYFLESQGEQKVKDLFLGKATALLDFDTGTKLFQAYFGNLDVLPRDTVINFGSDFKIMAKVKQLVKNKQHDTLLHAMDKIFEESPDYVAGKLDNIIKFMLEIPAELSYRFLTTLTEITQKEPKWTTVWEDLHIKVDETPELKQALNQK